MLGNELCHDDPGECHDRSAREIDAGGEDDQRLPDGDDAHDHHLLQDEGEILAGEEAVAASGEEDARGGEGHEWTERGGAREMLHVSRAPAVE